jgi:hypothetical protein
MPSHIPEISAFLKVDGREECSVEVLNPRKSCCFILYKCALVSYIHLLCHRLCRHHGRVSHFGVVPAFFHGVLVDIFCVCFAEAHNSMESDSNCLQHQRSLCVFLSVLEEWREDKRRTSRVVWRFSKSAHASSNVSTASFGNEEYGDVEKTEDRHDTSALSFSKSAQLSYALSRYVLGLENRSVDKEFDSEKEVVFIRSHTAEPCLSGHKFSQSHS